MSTKRDYDMEVIELKEVLAKLTPFMNKVSKTYSKTTGIDKKELFGEANIALVKAKKDFDSLRGKSFNAYAKYIIVDALNEYVRKNKSLISIPRYIHRANGIIKRIKKMIDQDDELFQKLISGEVVLDNPDINKQLTFLARAAKRAGITIKQMVDRSEFLPTPIDKKESFEVSTENEQQKLIMKIFIKQVQKGFTKEERTVANYLMDDVSVRNISKKEGIPVKEIKRIMVNIKKKMLKSLEF